MDPELNWRTQQVQTLVRLAHRLRETAEQRVRQPLAELRFACADERQAAALEQSTDIIADELNVKAVTREDHLDDLVRYSFKPNLKTLGPKYGKLLGAIRNELPQVDPQLLKALRNDESVTLVLGGEEVTLAPEDVLISTEQASDWASGDEAGIQVALSTALTPELIREGMARDFVRHIQQARKDAALDITDRIRIAYATDDADAQKAAQEWSAYIQSETLADALESKPQVGAAARSVLIGESQVLFVMSRV
ncbi:MAG: isoleucine--tRNA ligase, partial [Planctomycetaceae bacterium]|nr:isoleucine--tRNA ligase [Planctomycetaceae bacterium]